MQQRSGDAEHHVNLEPGLDRADDAEPVHTLARRIDEQQQHGAAADDSERVTHAAFG